MTDITRDSLLTTRYRSDSERVTAELALELARLLGDDWTACHGGDDEEPLTHCVLLVGPKAMLTVHGPSWAGRGRLEITATAPRGHVEPHSHRFPRPRITVADTRPATAIVREIERRLLPGAQEWCAEAESLTTQRDEDQARTDAGVARVITAVGGHARDRTVYPRHERIREVQVGSDGKLWKVELCDVTVEQFEAIAVLLSEQAA